LQSVLDKFKAQNFHIVTINVIGSQAVGAVKIMSNYSFVALKNPGGDWDWAGKNYGVHGTPTSFLVDSDGKILFDVPGLETVDSTNLCEEEVAGLLKWSASPESAHAALPATKAQP
jgi:thioredoxin-related protein